MSDTAQRVDELFARALELDTAGREALLAEQCADRPRLRTEVESLLRAHASMGDFLDEPATASIEALREPRLEPGGRVGAYRIRRLLGKGGAGAVYEAEQERPRRRVALKIMRTQVDSPAALRRFLEEAEIVGKLRHPGIEHVYEAGVHEGIPYIAMEYVEGARPLPEHADAAGLDRRARVALLARVCDAVHHGHQKGIIHRDLKPGNVLVDASGRPKVIDFGIARVAGADGEGGFAGTLPYVSPEACAPDPDEVDVRSDVWALGVLLHELLCGRLPFDVAGLPIPRALERIRTEEPEPLCVGGDLGAIAAKALARDRRRRYASAAALADDLRRFLAHRPVEARAGGVAYHLAKFVRRERLAALALLAVVAVSIVGAGVGGSLAVAHARARRSAEFQAYVANLAAASAALRVHDVAEARQRLDEAPAGLRDWEWRHLHASLDRSARTIVWPGARITTGAASPDGRLAAAGAAIEGRYGLRVWDLATGEVRHGRADLARKASGMACSADGRWLAVGLFDGRVEVLAAATGEVVWAFRPHREAVIDLAFDPAGRRLATASRDATIGLWDVARRRRERTLVGHGDRVISVRFAAGGERLVSGGREGTLRIWEVATGDEVAVLRGHTGSVEGVAVSPAGDRVASVSRDRTVRLWDLASGAEVATRLAHTSNVRDVAFSPDGSGFASASWDRTIRVWEPEHGQETNLLHGHTEGVVAVDYVDGGRRLVSFSFDGTVKVWEAAAPRPVLNAHADVVSALAFSGDGETLASASHDGSLCLWDAATWRLRARRELPDRVWNVALSADGSRVAAAVPGEAARLWTRGAEQRLPMSYDVAFAGKTLLLAGMNQVVLWDCEAGRQEGVLALPGNGAVTAVATARGRLAAGSSAGLVTLWDLATRARRAERRCGTHVLDVALSGDGRRLAVSDRTGGARLLDAATLEPIAELAGHGGVVGGLAFSPGGTRLATAGLDGSVRLWETENGRSVAVLHGHRFPVHSAAFSPDGTTLVTGDGSPEDPLSAIRIWRAPPR